VSRGPSIAPSHAGTQTHSNVAHIGRSSNFHRAMVDKAVIAAAESARVLKTAGIQQVAGQRKTWRAEMCGDQAGPAELGLRPSRWLLGAWRAWLGCQDARTVEEGIHKSRNGRERSRATVVGARDR
jgi:hypothetical protein